MTDSGLLAVSVIMGTLAIVASVRYRLPMTFLYSLAGDTHAIVLCVARGGNPQGWKLPSYVRFDPNDITNFFERTLGEQCIHQASMED